MKMFLTRFGQNSRMVICGDPRQVDIPGGDSHERPADAVRRLEDVDGIGVIRFTQRRRGAPPDRRADRRSL
jgi:phosphate starvation-inducible PhoH-like protein